MTQTCTPEAPCNRVAGDGRYVHGRDCRACYVRLRDAGKPPAAKKPCGGCGPSGYAPQSAADLVAVPAPPPLTLTPKSKRAVVTCVAGEKGLALWALSGPLMREYAARLGADLVVLDHVPAPAWPMSVKFGLWRALEWYDRVLFADADVLFRPTTSDLFGLFPADCIAAFDDLPFVLRDWPDGIAAYQRTRESQGMKRSAVRHYFNTGLVVAGRQHRPLFPPPARPIPKAHCSEQDLWNARIADAGVSVALMSDADHFQWWVHKDMGGAPPTAAMHFSGIGDGEKRLTLMQAAARACG